MNDCGLASLADAARSYGALNSEPRLTSPLIVEEKPICRQAMAGLVAESGPFAPVCAASSLDDALQTLEAARPSLVLVDLFTICYDFGGLGRLVSAAGAPVIAIDDRPNPTFAGLARQAGALGYACKSFELAQFKAVLLGVMSGASHFPVETIADGRPHRGARVVAGLSPRHLEVLKCVAVGMSNPQISQALGITVGTVKLHIHAILRLTGTRNRTEAALIAGRFVAPTMRG